MKILLPLLTLLLLLGCSSLTVFYDYDKNENFVEYHTYSWGASDSSHDALSKNELLRGNLIFIADSILESKNFKRIDDSTATTDFKIVLFGTVRSDTSLVTTTDASYSMGMGYGGGYYGPAYGRVPGYGYNYGWYDPWYGGSVGVTSPTTSTTSLEVHREGTLIFDIVNTKTNKLAWRGTAEQTIQQYSNSKKSDNVLRIILKKVFNNFPPPVKE